MIPLFEQYPLLRDNLPYISLGEFPTPVKRLSELGKKIGAGNLYLKHDGLSGSVYGGNKVRKLEFLLGDALQKKAEEVLTFGCAGSNHALATAIYGQKVGIRCISMLLSQPNAGYVQQNLLFNYICGAEIHHHGSEMALYLSSLIKLFDRILKSGKIPYVLLPGGSSPLGTVGHVNAGFELKEQIAEGLMPEPDQVFVPLGSMGTAVGLSIGFRAAGLKTRVVPVRVASVRYGNEKKFAALFRKTLALLRRSDPSFPGIEMSTDEIGITHDYFGERYALFTEKGMAAVDLVAESEGIRLEGTYTGKAMAALIDHVRNHGSANEVILFWNTCNARDFSGAIAGFDYMRIPQRFHRYFEEDVQQLDKH